MSLRKKVFWVIGILAGLFAIGTIYVFAAYYQSELGRDQLLRYVNQESKFVKLKNGAEVHFRDEGIEDGPVLLLFHGGLGSLHNWEGWTKHLSNEFRLVSLDFPAHGLTGRIPSDIYTRETMVETAKQLMDHLGIEKFSIAGNSMGGGVALQFALEHQDRVQTLILIGSEGIPNREEGYDASQFSDEKPLPPTDPSYKKVSKLEEFQTRFYSNANIKDVLTELVGNPSVLTDEFVDYYARIIRHRGNRYANILMFRQWLDPDADPRDLENRLKEITVPVLYIHGSKDNTVPERIARRFDELLPNCHLSIYDGVGHMAQIEKPEQSAAEVSEFIRNQIDHQN